jgi:hypothetical protein
MNDGIIPIFYPLIATMFVSSLLKPSFYSHQYNLMYPIVMLFIGNIINYTDNLSQHRYDNEEDLSKDFVSLLCLIPFVFIFTSINITFGFLDGLLLKSILDFNLIDSFITALALSVTLHFTETYRAVSQYKSWDFSILIERFNGGLLCASERIITHIIGILIFYYLVL